jgi:hypothetical protein
MRVPFGAKQAASCCVPKARRASFGFGFAGGPKGYLNPQPSALSPYPGGQWSEQSTYADLGVRNKELS